MAEVIGFLMIFLGGVKFQKGYAEKNEKEVIIGCFWACLAMLPLYLF
jgi:hypothetical protein